MSDESGYKWYRRTGLAYAKPWELSDDMNGVSISDKDKASGSPKYGDMIAQNPKSSRDRWLISAEYFADNFEEAKVLGAEKA